MSDASSVDNTVIIAVLTAVQLFVNGAQTLVMEYLRRKYPTGSSYPKALSRIEKLHITNTGETSLNPPPIKRSQKGE